MASSWNDNTMDMVRRQCWCGGMPCSVRQTKGNRLSQLDGGRVDRISEFSEFLYIHHPEIRHCNPPCSYSLNVGSSSSKVILKILKFCQNYSRWPAGVAIAEDFSPCLGRTDTRMRDGIPTKRRVAEVAEEIAESGFFHPLPCSLRTQHLCVWFDIKTTRERSLLYPKQLNHRFHGGH
jgi:hypothetical protein